MSGREFSANRTRGKIRRNAGKLAATFVAFGLLLGTGERIARRGGRGHLRSPRSRADAYGDAGHRRGDAGARRRHRAAPRRDACSAGDRRRRGARHLAHGDGGHRRAAGFRAGQDQSRSASAASAMIATAGSRVTHSSRRTMAQPGCRATCSKAGLARAYSLGADRGCAAELLAAERAAREARLGVWAEAAYAVRAAEPSAALLRHLATFQLVEGRVVRVATTRGSVYLNFGDRPAARVQRVAQARRSRPARSVRGKPEGPRGIAGARARLDCPAQWRAVHRSFRGRRSGSDRRRRSGGEPGSNPRAARRSRPK